MSELVTGGAAALLGVAGKATVDTTIQVSFLASLRLSMRLTKFFTAVQADP